MYGNKDSIILLRYSNSVFLLNIAQCRLGPKIFKLSNCRSDPDGADERQIFFLSKFCHKINVYNKKIADKYILVSIMQTIILQFICIQIFTSCYLQEGACLIYVICGCLRIVMSNTYCVVFLLCFSSSCVPYVASFSGLSFFYCPFGVL